MTACRENAPEIWLDKLPRPAKSTHKHMRGHLMCVTGGAASTGAARLAARAGLRTGAGLVTLLSPPSALLVNAAHVTAIMLRTFRDTAELVRHSADASAVIIGPAAGISEETRGNVLALLPGDAAIVLDADGLTVFRDTPTTLHADLRLSDVLTPHMGEFERVFPGLLAEAENREMAVRRAADIAGCTILLKGPETIMAAPGGQCVINRHASPYLATAGSGDVLAGMIGGWIAQGLDGFTAACTSVWMHGEAGRRLGPGLIAEDLGEAIPAVLSDLLKT